MSPKNKAHHVFAGVFAGGLLLIVVVAATIWGAPDSPREIFAKTLLQQMDLNSLRVNTATSISATIDGQNNLTGGLATDCSAVDLRTDTPQFACAISFSGWLTGTADQQYFVSGEVSLAAELPDRLYLRIDRLELPDTLPANYMRLVKELRGHWLAYPLPAQPTGKAAEQELFIKKLPIKNLQSSTQNGQLQISAELDWQQTFELLGAESLWQAPFTDLAELQAILSAAKVTLSLTLDPTSHALQQSNLKISIVAPPALTQAGINFSAELESATLYSQQNQPLEITTPTDVTELDLTGLGELLDL
jgi:hypothetical protein